MDTSDVHHRLLAASSALYNEDIEDDKKNLTKIQKFFTMNRLSQSSRSHHSIENNDIETHKHLQRFSHRKKSSATVVINPTLHSTEKPTNARIVRIRLIFIHIGEIDTLNEKYQADIYLEARWKEMGMNLSRLNLTSEQQTQLLYENISVKINEFNSLIHWSPQLFIENAIAQIGEQDRWFTIKKIASTNDQSSFPSIVDINICEHRRIKGVFWEKLELKHFPIDVQDLTISITSHHHVENCLLVEHEELRSSINREAFFDQQEWSLYEHVGTEVRETNEAYSFEVENNEKEQKKHPVLAVTCRAARRPGYYYWNGFCLVFLITVASFCVFSIPPDVPQSRLQITSTLLLTSVTFRWVVNRSLPQISYLTTLDIYAILSIIILVVLCIWHSVIASVIFFNPTLTEKIEPTNTFVIIDRYVFVGLFTIYSIIHIALFLWLIHVPYKRRREMAYLDREYAAKRHIQLTSRLSVYASKNDLGFRRSSSIFDIPPIMKSAVPRKHSDGVIIVPNATSFIPIQEEANESRKSTMNIIELREQDDEYFDHRNDINNELRSTQITHVDHF